MGQVHGKVMVRLYVYPETKAFLKDLAVQTGFEARNGQPDCGSALDALVEEVGRTMRLVKAGARLKGESEIWEGQAEALAERQYQQGLKRKAASQTANARRRAAERSTRYLDPEESS